MDCKMIIRRTKTIRISYEAFLACYINIMLIIDIVRRCFNCFNLSFKYDSEVQALLYVVLFLFLLSKKFFKPDKMTGVLTVAVVSTGMFVYGFVMEPQVSQILLVSMLQFFTLVFGTCIFVKEVDNYKRFLDALKLYIYVALVYCALVVATQSKQGFALYSMTFSFNCFIPLGSALIISFFEKKRKYMIYAGILLAVNMMIGSRSIILFALAIIAAIFLYLTRKKYYFIKIILGMTTIIVAFAFQSVMRAIGGILLRFMPNSRTIELLANGKLFILSGREKYYNIVENAIKERPFAIRGILTDRILIGNSIGHTSYITEYPHNIVLEVFYQHGVLIGLLLLLLLIGMIIRAVIYTLRLGEVGKCQMAFVILAISFATCQLLVSNSYLISSSFGLLIGVLLNYQNRSEVIARE